MLERQIMFKQLQELQRQKKLQELNNARQQNVIDQLSLMRNGIPARDASQMFMLGNANLGHGLSNGLVYSQAQNQGMHSMALDGVPMSREPAGLFGPVFANIGGQMGKVRQVRYEEFGGGQEGGWPGGISETPENVNAILDPLEQKILFNTEDNTWEMSFGKGTESHENMFENTDHSGDFPSIQSGSWSALMQSAVAEAASGDAVTQEEWSGLSFQNPELSNENQHSNLVESGKNSTPWLYNNLQKPELLNPSNASSSFPGFLHLQNQKEEDTHSDSNQLPLKQSGQGFLPDIQKNFRASETASFRSNDYSAIPDFMNRSSGFPPPNSTAQPSHNMLELLHKVDKEHSPENEPANAFTPVPSQYFGLKLAPPTQRPLINLFDPSQIAQEPGHSSKAFQDPNQGTSHLVSVKNQDGQESSQLSPMGQQVASSTRQPNVWVDVPAPQSASGTQMIDSQGSDGKPHFGKESLSGNPKANAASCSLVQGSNRVHHASISPRDLEAFGYSLKQANLSPYNHSLLNPIKNERVHGNYKVQPNMVAYKKSPFLLKNHEASRNEQMSTYDARIGNISAQQLLVGWPAEKLQRDSALAHVNLAGNAQNGNAHLSSPYLQHLDMANQNLALLKSRKRKIPSFEPWLKEVTEGCSRLHDMSTAEVEWAYAANRLPEKLKDEAEEAADSLRMVHPKRRLILTTQLMQLLFRSTPNASTQYDIMTYYAAKLALGDACGLASHKPDSLSVKNITSKGGGDQDLSKNIEGFVDRSKRLEDELLRLETGASSFLDTRLEFQDLDKFSVINRFAKFHGRGPLVAANGASTMPKLYPQRYVTASPMPKTVPEGQNCLLL